jgi:hypothetical protein
LSTAEFAALQPQTTTTTTTPANHYTTTDMATVPVEAAAKPFQQRWGDDAHTALLCIFVDIMTSSGTASLNSHQERITAGMAARGFAFSWEATR